MARGLNHDAAIRRENDQVNTEKKIIEAMRQRVGQHYRDHRSDHDLSAGSIPHREQGPGIHEAHRNPDSDPKAEIFPLCFGGCRCAGGQPKWGNHCVARE